jgi:uncharacterized protein (DUF1501 family)
MNLKTRREFLRSTVLGGALTWTVPSFLAKTFGELHAASLGSALQTPTGKDSRILVVLQMAGGNDGLNAIVPYTNDFYYRARTSLAVRPNQVLRLNDKFGLHPSLAGFQPLYAEGHLSVLQGVGYPNPNRSHFRSTEIWQTAIESSQFEKHGWLGRYFDNACPGNDPSFGVAIGSQMPQSFASARHLGITLQNPENYRFAAGDDSEMGAALETSLKKMNGAEATAPESASELPALDSDGSIGAIGGTPTAGSSPLDFLERTALDAQLSSETIMAVSKKVENQATYPASALANSLKLIARLIGGGMTTRVYYLSQGGYDTHINQAPTQERLLRDLGGAVKAFVEDLKAQGNLGRVLLMTFSEFGRRVTQNANGGTDHGAAAPLFIVGERVKAPFQGQFPSLAPADLFNGDMRYTADFRSVYAAVLENWLKVNSQTILKGKYTPFGV